MFCCCLGSPLPTLISVHFGDALAHFLFHLNLETLPRQHFVIRAQHQIVVLNPFQTKRFEQVSFEAKEHLLLGQMLR